MKRAYLLCHGLGFSNAYWRNLIPLLDGEVIFFDKDFTADSSQNYIGIGHSIGFQKLNNSGVRFDFIVGLHGFLNFCGNKSSERKVREQNINRMIELFRYNFHKTLRIFYKACQYPGMPSENTDIDDVISDLQSMKKSYKHCGYPTLIIGSNKDKIVPTSILDDNFLKIKNAVVEEINDATHSLGFFKADYVSERLNKFISERQN